MELDIRLETLVREEPTATRGIINRNQHQLQSGMASDDLGIGALTLSSSEAQPQALEEKPDLALESFADGEGVDAAAPVVDDKPAPALVMRGGADAAFGDWGQAKATGPVHHRCLAGAATHEGWAMRDDNEEGWDAEFMEETLLNATCWDAGSGAGVSARRLETDLRAHRLEPLPTGGSELLVCSLRQFSLLVSVLDLDGRLCDEPGLHLRVRLVYAGDHSPVEPSKGEPPLTGETEAAPMGGVATFRLRIGALSYHHGRRNFRLLVEALEPSLQYGPLAACTQPLRSVARLPNERALVSEVTSPTARARAIATARLPQLVTPYQPQLLPPVHGRRS